MDGGEHWIIDAEGVDSAALAGPAGRAALEALFEALVHDLGLHPLGRAAVHTFDGCDGAPGAGGSTALLPLSESHLAAHGFPEAGVLSLDLFTCRRRPGPDWEALLARHLGPCRVRVRRLARGAGATSEQEARP